MYNAGTVKPVFIISGTEGGGGGGGGGWSGFHRQVARK